MDRETGRTMEDLARSTEATAEEGRRKYHEMRREMGDRLGRYYDEGRERARRLEQSMERYIRERPISSVLIASCCALCAGFVIGMMIRR